MRRRGTPFAGLLYIGLAVTAGGPRVVEFNARFGDPETQVVLALLESPLCELLNWAATGGTPPIVSWADAAAVTVVLAATGYPGTPRTGDVVTGAEQGGVIHAGTRRREDGAIVSSGGRVLSLTATAPTLAEARADAYRLVEAVDLADGQFRSDIGLRAVRAEITV
jgi:phosphoribosylamine--glycine ligase